MLQLGIGYMGFIKLFSLLLYIFENFRKAKLKNITKFLKMLDYVCELNDTRFDYR